MINEVLRNVELLKTEIQEQMTAQGITTSGKTAGSLHIVQDDLGIRLVSDNSGAPITTIEAGREGGKIPFNFKDIIIEWSKDKGLSFASEEEREKFAGAVVFGKNGIKKEGFGRTTGIQTSHLPYGQTRNDIYTIPIQNFSDRLKAKFGDNIIIDIVVPLH